MTTQQDERAELIQFAKDHTIGGSEFNRKMAQIAALLQADAEVGGEAIEKFEQEDVEAVAACLGDDAAQLRQENDEDERAENMDRAATMLTWMLLTHPLYTHPQPQAVAQGCAECGKTSTSDSMWALYCLDCVQKHGIGAMQWIELVHELCPEGIEELCDECGGEDSKCHAGCTYRKARAMLSASPASPAAAQVEDWRDGVNVARLRAALTRMGVATEPSEEGMAADLENWVNTLTRAVAAGQPAAQVAQPLTELVRNLVKAYTDEARGVLDETYRFASQSPRGQQNINAVMQLLDDIDAAIVPVEAVHGIGKDHA